jgi:energy-coupling factor transporter ATP-binding protein EcfA2
MLKLHDVYLNEYVAGTESPTIYHRWCLISTVSALLGRNFHFPYGHFTIYPNQFCMLIGSPGARKSSAINIAKSLLRETGFDRIAEGKTTKEKFLLDLYGQEDDANGMPATGLASLLAGADDDTPHEMYIAADEFTNFSGAGNYEFFSLLGELWDCPDSLPVRTKNSKSFTIQQPVVNIIAGNTHAGFAAAFPPDIMGQGFLSRMILVFGEPSSKRITFPTKPDDKLKQELAAHLRQIRLLIHGEAKLEPAATTAIDYLYQQHQDLADSRLKHYSTRRIVHLIKLCLINAAMRLSTTITEKDVVLANSILSWTEEFMPRALGEFGKSKHSDVTAKLLEGLATATEPQTIHDLYKLVATDVEKYNQMPEIITGLVQADKIQRAGSGFLLKIAARKESGKYLDYSLLQEAAGSI